MYLKNFAVGPSLLRTIITVNYIQIQNLAFLSFCELHIVCKSQKNLLNTLQFNDSITKNLKSGVFYNFQCWICNEFIHGKCLRNLNVTIKEHLIILSMTEKILELMISIVEDLLIVCSHPPWNKKKGLKESI